MKLAKLEDRVAKLEEELTALSKKVNARNGEHAGNGKGIIAWIDELHGTISVNAVSRRARHLGEKWRKSQRPGRSTRKTAASLNDN